MFTLNKKYISIVVVSILLISSIIGMLIMKSQLEYHNSKMSEIYFSIFRILFFGTLIVILTDWLFKRWKEYQQLKNEKIAAELSNLKNQVSPHFFFNTLNNLYGLIKKDSDKAREFVLKLSELMRYSIYNGDVEKVSLKDEVAFLENFIDLHEIRYFNSIKIDFVKDIQDEDVSLSPLFLIILLENAFKHGAEKLTDNACIGITLKTENNTLFFSVKNNFDPSELIDNKGLGLLNLRKRLALLYPDKHRLDISIDNNIYMTQLELELW